ncbi:MAG: prolyl-tRNA synthetase associated domain-containing protein [Bacteroidaceae bacterium]|nr:prolyl-tRNA synthetase associated domain-containing protein [Bacteroidaceae bacterium]
MPDTSYPPIGQPQVYDRLHALGIPFTYTEHPATPTIDDGRPYWGDLPGTHCKNLFFRNHKGNRHYLIVFQCDHNMAIHDLEHILHQGKMSLASEWRMDKYLGLKAGSVSPFGLVNNAEHHVHVFLDENLKNYTHVSFHPNDNRASLNIRLDDFIRYMDSTGNTYEWIKLY